ncbi:alpha/beta hydrolase [Caulobacter endophyticus]|uniref:1,4-beta-xylanase n=1 Tax=Caulobacter endophyticus TaxID=2172652 RepID=A0A2T9KCZ2_9CAUL|nr:alpha/beta hydrolase [Caulobacter endophyticus]PVM93816.1 1,4-beta-xylanase [Caulobacter endophyticus]
MRRIVLAAVVALALPAIAEAQQRVALWPNGAPGFEARKAIPEQAAEYWAKSINDPSVTAYLPPADKATGAAVIVLPGGGHKMLVIHPEGTDVAKVLNPMGVAVFVLKYRLSQEEGSPYTIDHARQDAVRAVRVVRSRAAELGVDPNKIGLMGFSGGGEVVDLAIYGSTAKDPKVDTVDAVSGRPDFQVLIYPGPVGVPDKIPADAPPAFILAADDDDCCSIPPVELLSKFRAAKVPVEFHLFQSGGHAFNMGFRTDKAAIKAWPDRLRDWLADNGWTTKR